MSVTQPCLAALMTTDNYRARYNTPAADSGSIRMSLTTGPDAMLSMRRVGEP